MVIERKPTRYAHSDGHTDVCYSQDGSKLITCGTDGDIRIWSGFDDDDPIQTCVGEWSLCVQHNKDNLYVSTNNCTVQVLSFPDGQRTGILKTLTAFVNHMIISRDKKYIILACEDAQLRMINLDDAKEEFFFDDIQGPPLSVAICPYSKYIAAASGDTFLRIWSVEDQKLVHKLNCVPKVNSFINAKVLCRIDFDRMGQHVAYPEKNAVNIFNIAEKTSKHILTCDKVTGTYSIVKYSPCSNYIAAVSLTGDIVIWNVITTRVNSHTTHSKSISICALTWNPLGNGEIAYCDVEGQLGIVLNCINDDEEKPQNEFIEDECSEDMNDDNMSCKLDMNDDDEDNENAISLEKIRKDVMGDGSDTERNDIPSRASTPRPRTPEIPLQISFMPTSTPTHLDPRYMCWNDVGIVRCYGSSLDDDVDSGKHIEVEFHDYSFHNSMLMQNYQGYFLGTLSTAALAIANANQITVVPLAASTKEWNLTVDEGDEIVCVACSKEFVCFGTSNYFVRICSIYGIQRAVFCVPGPIVSMAAFNNFLLVAYHLSPVRNADQCIQIMFVKLEGFRINCSELNVPLRPESQLQWLGFTDVGTPAIMDSTGILCIYPAKSNAWIPICDSRNISTSPADGFFVTAVYEKLQTVRGIICKGSMYPSFTPTPVQSEHPLQALFLDVSSEKVTYESNLFMSTVLNAENAEKKFKETALKTFALACKNNLEEKALELVEMIQNQQLITLAIKYANRLDKKRLVEKLSALTGNYSQEETFTPPPVKVNRRLTLSSSKTTLNKSESKRKDTPNEKPRILSETTVSTNNTPEVNISINTQESLFAEEKPSSNPFAKKHFIPASHDKVDKSDVGTKENNTDSEGEKRKRSDSDNEEKQDKQRKLNEFFY